jgi:GrpB-like predicted nucleotidyltransferase (UPF0157 family)
MSRRKVMNLALRNPKGSPTPTVSEFVVALERLSSADLARVVRFLRLLKSASQSSKATVAAMMKSPARAWKKSSPLSRPRPGTEAFAAFAAVLQRQHPMTIRVLPHDPRWPAIYDIEARRIRRALGGVVVRLHHIGGTAIPAMLTRPIIDIAMEVRDVKALDDEAARIQSLGYENKGEFGIPNRRYFHHNDETGTRLHHIHAFAVDDVRITQHLAFREYLIAHAQIARLYGKLKERLAAQSADNVDAYVDGKNVFVEHYLARALEWYAEETAARRGSTTS